MNAIERIEQAFLQLTFAIKLMAHIELGHVDKELLDSHVLVKLKKRNVSFPANAFLAKADIVLAAQNNYVITLGFSAITLDRAFEAAGFVRDLPITSTHRDLRALVYMIRCAFAHDMMHPVWQARGPAYARKLSVSLPSGPVILDMAALHDKPFHDADIGGIENYLEIRDAVVTAVKKRLLET